MLDFIVLGQVPGTSIEVSFVLAVIGLLAVLTIILGYLLIKRLWAQAVLTARTLLQLEFISL